MTARLKRHADCADTDIHVPLIVRGPGIPQNETLNVVTSHTDLAPTFLSIAGTTRNGLDGKRLPTTVEASQASNKTEHVAIEYWGLVSESTSTNGIYLRRQAVPEGIYGYKSNKLQQEGNSYKNNTYKGIRLVSDDYSLYYSVWCTNDVEFYNLKVRYSLRYSLKCLRRMLTSTG